MATYPPPYSSRDQVRQQQRAQRDAYRAQRDYQRAQRRPSVLRPIILIAIGVIALLLETGKIYGPAFWDWCIRWWPLLVIGLGVLSLGEWWLERDSPYGSRRMGGGVVFLIILLVVAGSASHHLSHGRGMHWFDSQNGDDDFAWHMFGQEHDADVTLDEAAPANAAVRIRNPHGDVIIGTSADGRVHVSAHDVVYESSDKQATRQLTRLAPKMKMSGSTVEIGGEEINGAHVDMTVSLPEGASLDIYAGHGDVSVNGTKSSVKVSASNGDVKLDDLAGSVTTHMSKGDFSARDIAGTIAIDGRMDDVTLTNVKSDVSINGDFFGDMHLQAVTAPVSLHSSRTDVTLASLPGDLTLDSGDLSFRNVNGPVRVTTRSKDVEGSNVHGATHIENSNGDITLNVASPLDEIVVHNNNGAVDLTLPAKAGFNLDASTSDGELATDFDVPITGSDDKHAANGKVGAGGPRVSVISDHGDIHIKKAGSVADDSSNSDDATPPGAPDAPKPPKAPRHLHSSTTEDPQPTVQ